MVRETRSRDRGKLESLVPPERPVKETPLQFTAESQPLNPRADENRQPSQVIGPTDRRIRRGRQRSEEEWSADDESRPSSRAKETGRKKRPQMKTESSASESTSFRENPPPARVQTNVPSSRTRGSDVGGERPAPPVKQPRKPPAQNREPASETSSNIPSRTKERTVDRERPAPPAKQPRKPQEQNPPAERRERKSGRLDSKTPSESADRVSTAV